MEKQSSRRVTLADVAAMAGTSTTAVSLVLNDRPGSRLSAATSERIRSAAAELGYRPNHAARSLRLGRTATLGFVSGEVTITRYASGMIRGVLDAAREAGHTVLIGEVENMIDTHQSVHDATRRPDAMGEVVATMLDHGVDGLIIAVQRARQIDLPALPHELPVVLLNASAAGHRRTVLRDEARAGDEATRALLDAGHRDLVLLGWNPELTDPRLSNQAGLRYQGIDQALDAVEGLHVHRLSCDWDGPDEARERLGALWDAGERPTGIVALNDRIAFGAYQALQERGVRLPDEVSLVSFDDEELASYLRPALTTARIPYEQMGRLAVQMVLDPTLPANALVPMPLQVRESVAPAGR